MPIFFGCVVTITFDELASLVPTARIELVAMMVPFVPRNFVAPAPCRAAAHDEREQRDGEGSLHGQLGEQPALAPNAVQALSFCVCVATSQSEQNERRSSAF